MTHIVLIGGSGQIGRILARAWHGRGHQVTAVSRHPVAEAWGTATWNPQAIDGWERHLDGADVVVNLAGRSVDCRYHEANRQEILTSRTGSVRILGEALRRIAKPPALWLQMSTATIYAHTFGPAHAEDGILGGDEAAAPSTWRFSIDVARAWEDAARAAAVPGVRQVLLRSAMVMSPDPGGVFAAFRGLARWGLGGAHGPGDQYVSWIHDQDFAAALDFLIERTDLDGVVNLAAPGPLPNRAFMAELRRHVGPGFGLPTPTWLLEIGAWVRRTKSELLLKSRRVVPGGLCEAGFTFRHPDWAGAAADLCRRWGQR